jgi:tetratricopeptide (TPR) repeat protein
VSVDLQGAKVVEPYVQGTTFPTVVDMENKLANHFGFKVVPNGIFIDEEGTIRLLKQGFQVTDDKHIQAVEMLLREEIEKMEFENENYKMDTSKHLQIQLSHTKFKLGMEYSQQGKKDAALKELDEALQLDQDNFLIRKQRWYIRYPEKFAPTIDFEWQQQQLEEERSAEAALNDNLECGPEGCIIPPQ